MRTVEVHTSDKVQLGQATRVESSVISVVCLETYQITDALDPNKACFVGLEPNDCHANCLLLVLLWTLSLTCDT